MHLVHTVHSIKKDYYIHLMHLRVGIRNIFINLYSTSLPHKMSMSENTGATLVEVINVLENFAPKHLSESWDNTGLLVEPYTPRKITKILLTNDLTEDVALEANTNNCQMIISYHPPIFAPLKSITQGAWKEKIVSLLLENRMSLYSPHTSWDSVQGGVNDWLASAFPVAESAPIIPGSNPKEGAGRLITINVGFSFIEAIEKIKALCNLTHVRFAIGKNKMLSDEVHKVALCAGSGASVLKGVAADLYLTGEMLHHDVLDATQRGISVILTNHSDSERGFLLGFSSKLQKELNSKVEVIVSKTDKDPLVTV